MGATLTISRAHLEMDPFGPIGTDVDSGFTLDKEVSLGSITWRKRTFEQDNVPGRTMRAYTRDTMVARGGIKCHGDDEQDLQDKLAEVIQALTQMPADGSPFQPFNITYDHGDARYKFKCLEPADLTFGGGDDLDDEEMAAVTQSVGFVVVRNPIPILGPI